MDYMVRFIGHIDERKRPESFPKEVYADMFARVGTEQDLKKAINDYSMLFMTQQCMVVPKEPGGLEDMLKPKYDARIMVPIHMITYIETVTKKISGEIPEINTDGIAMLTDGTKVTVQ